MRSRLVLFEDHYPHAKWSERNEERRGGPYSKFCSPKKKPATLFFFFQNFAFVNSFGAKAARKRADHRLANDTTPFFLFRVLDNKPQSALGSDFTLVFRAEPISEAHAHYGDLRF